MLSAQPAPAICSSRQTKWSDDHLSDQRQPVWPHYWRGGKNFDYHADDIAAACDTLHEFDLPEHLVVDFSHGNCQKQHRRQLEVCEDICQQIRNGSTAIAGIMAESFLREGTQKIVGGQPLTYGQSITDPCLGWEDTERLVEKLASAVDTRF